MRSASASPDQGLLRRPQGGAWSSRAPAVRPTSRCRPTRSISRRAEWRGIIDAGRRRLASRRSAAGQRRQADRRSRRPPGPQLRRRARRQCRQRLRRGGRAMCRRCRPTASRVILAAWSDGSRERLGPCARRSRPQDRADDRCLARAAFALSSPAPSALAVWGFETGFEAGELAVIGEQDILGDRLVRAAHARRAAPQDFIAEAVVRSRRATSSSMSITASAASSACKTIDGGRRAA